ncbi:Putative protein of unknown function [Podospora comata]|uniref:Uncharacterized protein n=1 Tax=Podospora comata TaxID=48703 RepID=A0ABY6RTS8_PODCO|nr:Putative protein of unknown function [Podospora comata]
MGFNTAYDVRQDFEALLYQEEDKQARRLVNLGEFLRGFHRSHPLHCGLFIVCVRYDDLLFCQHIEREGSSLLLPGQLYHALGTIAPSNPWVEMEFLYAVQGGKTRWFFGDIPRNPDGYWKQVDLTQGGSVVDWMANVTGKQKMKISFTHSISTIAHQAKQAKRLERHAARQLNLISKTVPCFDAVQHGLETIDPESGLSFKDNHLTLDHIFERIKKSEAANSKRHKEAVDQL